MTEYLFGYGSLISPESRKQTGVTGRSIACRCLGIKRSWSMPIDQVSGIALNISLDKNSSCNGVLIEISPDQLFKFDQREIGYKRILIDRQNLAFPDKEMAGVLEPNDSVWAYILAKAKKIPPNYKILQSYVDVVLNGCLINGKKFALEFVESTEGWAQPWLLDREKPLYPRPLRGKYDKEEIDFLVKKYYR